MICWKSGMGSVPCIACLILYASAIVCSTVVSGKGYAPMAQSDKASSQWTKGLSNTSNEGAISKEKIA